MERSKQTSGRWKALAILAICLLPLAASYFTYYVIKPQARTNYGTLLEPRDYPIPALQATALDGTPAGLDAYQGKWIMLQVDSAQCPQPCRNKLFQMRQLRLTQGRERDRVERVWLVTDQNPVETQLLREYDGTHLLRVRPEIVKNWLPATAGTTVADHIYMIDPLGNLMMRFPKDADPNKIKKDLTRLLKASSIG
ncbi:MAG: cytochrome C oxidase subunit I [Gallionellales bacterium RBG_16_56_9]|nr:MAG: cytochrome C oxidase subunit I [Gallionellales bacterium RBG_16_56_9]